METGKNYYLFLLIIALCLCAIPYPSYATILTDGKNNKFVKTIMGDFNGDGAKEDVTLELKKTDENLWSDFDLKVRSGEKEFVVKNALLEQSPNLCGVIKVSVSPKKRPFIGVIYNCGAHSAGLDLYAFDGKSIKKVAEIGSDDPCIELKDIDKDDENEIVADGRDYSNNPIEDRFIKTYKYDGSKWELISVYETRTKKYFPQERLAKWRKGIYD